MIDAKRFWSRVDVRGEDECWLWKGPLATSGYGTGMYVDGKQTRAHRLAWWLHIGAKPTLHVLHSCDNRQCCNPSHLREGTQADNSRDMVIRGRSLRGAASPCAIFNHEIAECVRQCAAEGMTHREIASHGMSRSNVSRILSGKIWAPAAAPDMHQQTPVS